MQIECPDHGVHGLSDEQIAYYQANPDETPRCPICHQEVEFYEDDEDDDGVNRDDFLAAVIAAHKEIEDKYDSDLTLTLDVWTANFNSLLDN